MPNQLQHSKSPYLKQHADNPVQWYEWNEDTLALAKKENKIIIVSVGYSACHWCHVMAHESFEDLPTAKLMNEHFINIKIDREERPDLDAIYMDACQLISGSGGWPLNVFALPSGLPFHAGTYFPKHQWQNTLMQIAKLWQTEPEKVASYATDLKEGLEKVSGLGIIVSPDPDHTIEKTTVAFQQQFDNKHGGFNRAPKFPMPVVWKFLLESSHYYDLTHIENHVLFTLEQMSLGGIYDSIEGGFARYSVDKRWFAPHFEKMLYDNAQLISLFINAYQLTPNPLFLKIAEDTASFIENQWKSKTGGYFSAFDADSEGVEGKYYCLTWDEVRALKLQEEETFITYFQITKEGNWEHGLNILYPILTPQKFSAQENIENFNGILNDWKNKIATHRTTKVKPELDDKQNTAWNGLMLSALCHLSAVAPRWEPFAQELYNYIHQQCFKGNVLYHIIKDEQPYIEGFLEDYSATIQATLHYFEVFNTEEVLLFAQQLLDKAIELFYIETDGFFAMATQKHHQIITNKVEVTDNVIPSSNSIMAENLLKLGLILENDAYFKKGEHMVNQMANKALSHAEYYANWTRLLLIKSRGYPYIISNQKIPNQQKAKVWITFESSKDGQIPLFQNKDLGQGSKIYFCANYTCSPPVSNPEEIIFD